MRIDRQWVISGDSAQSALFQQGYLVSERQRRRGVKWVLMTKHVPETHAEHAARARLATPCTAHHVNYGGGCLNCGWSPPAV